MMHFFPSQVCLPDKYNNDRTSPIATAIKLVIFLATQVIPLFCIYSGVLLVRLAFSFKLNEEAEFRTEESYVFVIEKQTIGNETKVNKKTEMLNQMTF